MPRRGYFPAGPCSLLTQWPGADPAAGAEFTQTVPAGRRWVIRSFGFRLTASAVIGARNPTVRVRDAAGNVVFYFAQNLAFTISTVNQLYFAVFGYQPTAQLFSGVTYNYFFIPPLMLESGSIIDTITSGILGGDQYNGGGVNGGICVEEYLVNTP